MGSPASLAHLDLSGLGAEGRVYSGVGDVPEMFYRLETPAQRWPDFCLDDAGVEEFVNHVRGRGVIIAMPEDVRFLAFEAQVTGRS